MKAARYIVIIVAALATMTLATRAAERVTAEGGCPDLNHDPILAVYRGTPAEISATIECPVGTLGKVYLQVRLTDVGKPVEIEMRKGVNDAYEAKVPASMIAGLPRFWYYVDARGTNEDGEETMAQTRWHAVSILDPIVAADLSQPPKVAAAEGGSGSAFGWFIGGAAAVGAGFVIDHNQSGYHAAGERSAPDDTASGGRRRMVLDRNGHSADSPAPSVSPPPPPAGGGGGGGPPSPPPPCGLTGLENAALGNTSACSGSGNLNVIVCGYCSGAEITVETSWGPSGNMTTSRRGGRGRTGLAPDDCNPGAPPLFSLPKPSPRPTDPEVETISIYVNGTLIKQFQWPSAADLSGCGGGAAN